jgi:hypothetical protein
MALNTTMPQDIPKSSDTLAGIPRDLLGPIPAEIRLGANVLMMMETPPDVGDVITVTMRLKIKRKAEDEGGEGGDERVHFRGAKIVAAWLKGDPEPPNATMTSPHSSATTVRPPTIPRRWVTCWTTSVGRRSRTWGGR